MYWIESLNMYIQYIYIFMFQLIKYFQYINKKDIFQVMKMLILLQCCVALSLFCATAAQEEVINNKSS